MGLLRLLTAGKCLVGLQQAPTPYRLTNQRLLPEFGSKKNPYARTPKAAPSQGALDVLATAKADSQATTARQARVSGAPAVKTQSNGAHAGDHRPRQLGRDAEKRHPSHDVAAGGDARTPGLERTESKRRPWHARLQAMLPGRGLQRGHPRHQSFTKPLVQEEFSLEKVKVVRNDLSDSDLEVVRAAQVVPDRPALGERQSKALVRPAWVRAAGRLLGQSKLT